MTPEECRKLRPRAMSNATVFPRRSQANSSLLRPNACLRFPPCRATAHLVIGRLTQDTAYWNSDTTPPCSNAPYGLPHSPILCRHAGRQTDSQILLLRRLTSQTDRLSDSQTDRQIPVLIRLTAQTDRLSGKTVSQTDSQTDRQISVLRRLTTQTSRQANKHWLLIHVVTVTPASSSRPASLQPG